MDTYLNMFHILAHPGCALYLMWVLRLSCLPSVSIEDNNQFCSQLSQTVFIFQGFGFHSSPKKHELGRISSIVGSIGEKDASGRLKWGLVHNKQCRGR